MEKKCKKAKWLSGEALQITEKKKSEKQRRKEKIQASECRVPENSKERYESLPQQSMKRNRETEWERLEISSRKLELRREHFMQRWAQ